MSHKLNSAIAVIGIDIGKNSFHVVGHDKRGAITLRQKWSRGQVEARLANLPPCLIGMEACVGRIISAARGTSMPSTLAVYALKMAGSFWSGHHICKIAVCPLFSNRDRICCSGLNDVQCHERK